MKLSISCIYAILVFGLNVHLNAQFFGFVKSDTIIVLEAGDTLLYPWQGGVNYPQFSGIDMDYNGSEDLFIFDRTGNRIITLLNNGSPGMIDYYPDYFLRFKFPNLNEWVLLKDYDQDGNADIFSYYNGGVRVYRNSGNLLSGLEFTLVKDQLVSDYGTVNLVLFISLADIPAIVDVDNDQDLDILTFAVNGGCVEYHKNLSRELYGHSDSLIFVLSSDNWGNFTEGASGYDIFLSDSCDTLGLNPGAYRHSGSSLLSLDMDGDTDKDLVLGDVGGTNLTYLRNDGNINQALMGHIDFNFPQNFSSTLPANITLFPAAFFVDINNDLKRDLIVAPNASGGSETNAGVWRYQNDGMDDSPVFNFKENNFLQKDMIEVGEGAFPRFVDYNRDGLMDMVVGNTSYWNGTGQLALYENTGTLHHPQFELITNDLSGLSLLNYKNIIPTFGDMDGDGDDDMIIGEITGFIHYFENTSPVIPNSSANWVLTATQYFNIKENSFSAPCIIDLNQDGINDIVCGSRLGKLNYYQNSGTINAPNFSATPTILQLGGVNTVDPVISTSGYSIPEFFIHNGKLELFVGSLKGNIFHYTDIYDAANNIQSTFTLQSDNTGFIWDGIRSSISVTELNNDTYPDMIVGNYSGGVSLFFGNPTAASVENNLDELPIQIYPNPTSEYVVIDTESMVKGDLYLLDLTGRVLEQFPNYQTGNKISLHERENGFYIFMFRVNNRSRSFKVLKLK